MPGPIISPQYVSPFIQKQLPPNILNNGPNFVSFIQGYYQYLESSNGIINIARNLLNNINVDTANVGNFQETFLPNIPLNLPGDERLLLKHILDLYSSKGTSRSFDLLFRALYNKSVNIYIPATDILRVSDSGWYQPYYIEINGIPGSEVYDISSFINSRITGSVSGSQATVETFEQKFVENKVINVLYLSHISGNFISGEAIDFNANNTHYVNSPIINGSLTNITVQDGGEYFTLGDTLNVIGKGSSGQAIITSTEELTGIVDFKILNGGFGYTVNAEISITAPGTGSGASFQIGGLTNVQNMQVDQDLLLPYVDTALSANAYGFPAKPTGNLTNATIGSMLTFISLEVGSISFITQINGGIGYDTPPIVKVFEPVINALQIPDGMGGVWGDDAVVQANAVFANGVISSLQVVDSGFGYEPGELVTLTTNNNPNYIATGFAIIKNQGKSLGYFTNENGQLDSSKRIQDSTYYQAFSYEIQSDLSPNVYNNVVLNTLHPAGIAKYDKFCFIDQRVNPANNTISGNPSLIYALINQSTQGSIVFYNETNDDFSSAFNYEFS